MLMPSTDFPDEEEQQRNPNRDYRDDEEDAHGTGHYTGSWRRYRPAGICFPDRRSRKTA